MKIEKYLCNICHRKVKASDYSDDGNLITAKLNGPTDAPGQKMMKMSCPAVGNVHICKSCFDGLTMMIVWDSHRSESEAGKLQEPSQATADDGWHAEKFEKMVTKNAAKARLVKLGVSDEAGVVGAFEAKMEF